MVKVKIVKLEFDECLEYLPTYQVANQITQMVGHDPRACRRYAQRRAEGITPYSRFERRLVSILEIERESFSDAWSENMFLEIFASPLAHCFTAESTDGGLLGYIMFYLLPPEIQILNIAVKQSARNRQIGSLLLKSALEYKDIELFTLEVRESNLPAINLYKKLGFKIDGVRKNYYARPKENAILMSLERL